MGDKPSKVAATDMQRKSRWTQDAIVPVGWWSEKMSYRKGLEIIRL